MRYGLLTVCLAAANSGCMGCEKLTGPTVADLAIDDQGNAVALVLTRQWSDRALYSLGVGKERWERVDSGCGETDAVCVARDGALLLRGNAVPLCGSYDGGRTWSQVADSPTECGEITVDAGNPDYWYRFTYAGFALSRDGGQSWTEYPAEYFGMDWLAAMTVDSKIPGLVMLLADRYGEAGVNLLWSTDGGSTWRIHTIAPIGSCEWAGEQIWTGLRPDGVRRTYLVMDGQYAEKRGNQLINPQSVDCLMALDGLPEGILLVPEGNGILDGGMDTAFQSEAGPEITMRVFLQLFEHIDGHIQVLTAQRTNPDFMMVGLRPGERKGSVGGVRGAKDGSTPTMMNAGLPPPEPQPQYEPEGGGGGCVGGQVYCCAGPAGCQGDPSGGPCLHFSCDEGCGSSWVACN